MDEARPEDEAEIDFMLKCLALDVTTQREKVLVLLDGETLEAPLAQVLTTDRLVRHVPTHRVGMRQPAKVDCQLPTKTLSRHAKTGAVRRVFANTRNRRACLNQAGYCAPCGGRKNVGRVTMGEPTRR